MALPLATAYFLRVLGACAVEAPGGLIGGRVTQRRRLACLALLASAGRRGISRDKVTAYLWPEYGDDRARHFLSDTLYVLRSALGEQAVNVLGEHVALNVEHVKCDLVSFEEALERSDHAAAVSEYGGPFLDGFHISDAPEFERWVDAERERLANAYTVALEKLAEDARRRCDHVKAAEWWRRVASLRPYDGRAAHRLAEALEAGGDRAGAIRQIEVHLTLLRQDLEAEPDPALLQLAARLRTSPKPPSMAAAEVSTRDADAARLTTHAADASTRSARRRRIRPVYAGLLAAVLIALPMAARWGFRDGRGMANEAPSLAVLPFLDLSADSQREYFSDGISEEIIDALAKLPGLQVGARTSSFSFKGKNRPVEEIGRALHVGYLLEGSVQWEKEHVRVWAQLIDARTGYHVWSAQYDREPQRIFDVEDDIARSVADALGPALGRGMAATPRLRETRADVYQSYLQGRYVWSRGNYPKAISLFQTALGGDVSYAPAYAGLADAYARLQDVAQVPSTDGYVRAAEAAHRALGLDESLADAHIALAHVLMHQHEWQKAETEFRRGLALNPNYATGHAFYAMYLAARGRADDAVREARHARRLDPLGAETAVVCGAALRAVRHYDESARLVLSQLEIDPQHPFLHMQLAVTYTSMARYRDAMAELTRVGQLTQSPRARTRAREHFARALALSGAKTAAHDTLEIILHTVSETDVDPIPMAAALSAAGERDRAFAWLEKVDAQSEQVLQLYGPLVDQLRGDRRFAALLVRLGLERAVN